MRGKRRNGWFEKSSPKISPPAPVWYGWSNERLFLFIRRAPLPPSEDSMNIHALPAHVLLALVRLHSEGTRASLERLVEELRVRRGDVRRVLSALHREGFVDVLRMRPTLAGFALGRAYALQGAALPALRAPKLAAVVAA
jgi:hypothetical protein